MIRQFIIFLIVFCQCFNAKGQFFDDFTDTDLSNAPEWKGDLSDFMVNEEGLLQLNAEDKMVSRLYTQNVLPDSIQWDFEVRMDFSPSANNRLRIYLAIDDLNLEVASGYFFEIGENGANDALDLYYLNEGDPELLASGEMGALGSEPAYVQVSVQRFPSGQWFISTAYEENTPLSIAFEFMHSAYDLGGNQVFQIECNYTASRSDKFFFDNIGLQKYEKDTEGPEVVSVTLFDPMTIDLQVNEKLDAVSVNSLNNYQIEEFSGSISSAELFNNNTAIRLHLSENLGSGRTYKVNVSGLKDLNGNEGGMQAFEVFVLEEALPGDLVVNEILFNPETGGFDFVEIVNISDKFIFLGNLQIANLDKQEIKNIGADVSIDPGKYICFSEGTAYLMERYNTPDTARFLEIDLPSFNNEDGNVAILNGISGQVIDSYDYDEEQHFAELEDLNGVSLERVSPFDDKWFSASSASGFATPGYLNSIFVNPDFGTSDILSFENKTFSPNGDGTDDQLVIKYKLPDNGYQADILIFDQYGRQIRTLVNNELFPEQGFVLWDGLNENGESEDIGIYFILLEVFNVQGDVISARKPVILADFLK